MRKVFQALSIVVPAIFLGIGVSAQTKITGKNWMSHPQIKEIEGIFESVEQGEKAGTIVDKKFPLCRTPRKGRSASLYEGGAIQRVLVDKKGLIREMVWGFPSADYYYFVAVFYDPQGKPRLGMAVRDYLDGEKTTLSRAYLNPLGKTIWKDPEPEESDSSPLLRDLTEKLLREDPNANTGKFCLFWVKEKDTE